MPFGQRPDGTPGTLKEFCRDLGDILALYAQRNPQLAEATAPLIEVCKTGITQAETKAKATKDYRQANALLLGAFATSNDNMKPVSGAAARKPG